MKLSKEDAKVRRSSVIVTSSHSPFLFLCLNFSQAFFEEYHLPRRTRNFDKEEIYKGKHDRKKAFYRRVLANEEDRGELYPVWKAGWNTFADFGIGIGIYFTQLLVLAIVCFITGGILILGSHEYSTDDYGVSNGEDPFFFITAACPAPTNITVTLGCPTGYSNCTADYLPNCDIPRNVIIGDLAMSLIFAFAIFASKYLEDAIKEKLDTSVQTISDYSVEVLDPEPDADNPDEWYEFFSRFGSVRYISIIRKNEKIVYNCFHKHKLLHKLHSLQEQLQQLPPTNNIGGRAMTLTEQQHYQDHYYEQIQKKITNIYKKIDKLDIKLSKQYLHSFRVYRIYVTYEYEEHQRLCLQSLEVPDIYAKFDIKDLSNMKNLFRNENVLNVIEPVEPDNVLWQYLAYEHSNKRLFRIFLSYATTILTFTAVWYSIVAAQSYHNSVFLGFIIAVFDSLLPIIFEIYTDITLPISESSKQSNLQLRLFLARLLLSTLIPYLQTNWNKVLTTSFIQQVIIIQSSACFITPIISLLDIGNVIRRNYFAYYQSDTQQELNLKWSASEWSLADKYTGISKVLFVSLYYAILVPYSLYLAMIAFLLMFFIDRYLLLRKWKILPLFDESIAIRLRQQAILAVAAHMFVTIRFIYSWPMDQVWHHKDTNLYERVNKRPSWNVLHFEIKDWHTSAQRDYLPYYYAGMIVVFVLALYVWILYPLSEYCKRLFCYNLRLIGEAQEISFSQVNHNITVYEPAYPFRETKFLCSHLIDVKKEHRPSFVTAYDDENHDISYYIPEIHRPHVLSIIKYYSKEFEEEYIKSNPTSELANTVEEFLKKERIKSDKEKNKENNNKSIMPRSQLVTLDDNDESDEDDDNSINIEMIEAGNMRNQSSSTVPRISLPRSPSVRKASEPPQNSKGNLLRQSHYDRIRDSYHALPLHVELDHRTNPQEQLRQLQGNLPEELKQKIASKEVERVPTLAERSMGKKPFQRFSGVRQSTKITPQFSDSPPKQNYRKNRSYNYSDD